MKEQRIPTNLNVMAKLNMIRDRYNEELTDDERQALIMAENIILDNKELAEKYIKRQYRQKKCTRPMALVHFLFNRLRG